MKYRLLEKVTLKQLFLYLTVGLFSLVFITSMDVKAAENTNWAWPTSNHYVKSDYPNYPSGRPHTGTDFSIPLNSPVYSTCDGEVIEVISLTDSYGKHIKIKSIVNNSTMIMYYCHLNNFAVKAGDKVTSGQLIGYSGSTGNSTGPHLHYEVKDSQNNTHVNPRNYLPGTSYSFQELKIESEEDAYSSVYNYDYYTSKNPDVKNAFGNDRKATFEHFINRGMLEGRRASAEFDVNYYREQNQD
ncbi:MAG: M23 family metallopeptidase, partial [Lachnospiraceae bacterium]|nr:M23 family metallopeptidase [Lachnospiraceae bacterium]